MRGKTISGSNALLPLGPVGNAPRGSSLTIPASCKPSKTLTPRWNCPPSRRRCFGFRRLTTPAAPRWDAVLSGPRWTTLIKPPEPSRLSSPTIRPTFKPVSTSRCATPGAAGTWTRSALDDVVTRAVDNLERAAQAWTLAELLRFGGGAETVADDLRLCLGLRMGRGSCSSRRSFRRLAQPRSRHPCADLTTGGRVATGQRLFEMARSTTPRAASRARGGFTRVLAAVVLTPRLLRLSSPNPPASRS